MPDMLGLLNTVKAYKVEINQTQQTGLFCLDRGLFAGLKRHDDRKHFCPIVFASRRSHCKSETPECIFQQ